MSLPMHVQDGIAVVLAGLAALYLILRRWRVARRSGGACAGCEGCASPAAPANERLVTIGDSGGADGPGGGAQRR